MKYFVVIDDSITYIESKLTETFVLKDFLAQVPYSQPHFYEVFQVFTGMTVNEYLSKRRLSEAAIEIRDGKKKIIDVAMKYMYNNHETFTRAFKAEFNIAPINYRNKNIDITLLAKIDTSIYKSIDKLISKSGIITFKQLKTDIDKSLNRLKDLEFFKEIDINNTTHERSVKINPITFLDYMNSFPEIPLHKELYKNICNIDLTNNKEERNELIYLLAVIKKTIDSEASMNELELTSSITISEEELDINFQNINTLYDLHNPILRGNHYYYCVNKKILATLKNMLT